MGFTFFKGPFWGAYIRRGLSTEGNLRFKTDWASLIVGSKFAVFALFYFVFEGNFPSTSPRGGLYLERRFNGEFFALPVWGAYIWRGLYMEGLIFGILRYAILGFTYNCLDMYDRRQLSPLIDLTYHSVFKASLFRIVATIRAPWLGGLDHMGRMIALSWLRIFSAVSLSVVTTQRLPHRSSAIYEKCILVAHNLGISGLNQVKSG